MGCSKFCASVVVNRFGILGFTLTLLAALFAATPVADAALVYALTDENDLLSFDSATPGTLSNAGAISGLGGQDLIGIDIRPSNNQLYGVGSFGGIFTINPSTFAATQVATLSTSLSGSRFGIDFNPVVDRLRLVSNTEQNLRVNVDTGATLVDSALNYGGPSPSASVVGAGYTNSFDGASATTLYVIDAAADILAIQAPPNAGTLTPVGPLGGNAASLMGFDVFFDGVNNSGFAALLSATGGVSEFYSINLGTGAVTFIGQINGGDFIDGIAVVSVPEPATVALAGIGLLSAVFVRRRGR